MINEKELKDFPVIVALGKNVQNTLNTFNLTDKSLYTISHPAYIKRFFYHKFFDYYADIFNEIKGQIGKHIEFNQFEEFIDLNKEK